MTWNNTTFLLSTPTLDNVCADEGSEIAFAGRSNAGKSSLLNALCNRKVLALTSRTPGRTRHLVFFECDLKKQHRFVDLPGYGFAKASKNERKLWGKLIGDYFDQRKSLRGIVLISDVRQPLKETDFLLLSYMEKLHLPVHIYFSKLDKISKNELFKQKKLIEERLQGQPMCTFSFGSSVKRLGLEDVTAWINLYLR